MRLFVGVEIADNVRSVAAAIAETLRLRLPQIDPAFDARWIPAANLHITLWFIGEVDDARADAIVVAFGAPFPIAEFDLALAGAGAFPPSGAPRVIWLGVRQGSSSMQEIHRNLHDRLVPLGCEPERRRYSPHLTLARVKDADRRRGRALRDALQAVDADAGTCRVSAVTLFRSRLSPRGAAYEPLLRVPLN